MYVLLSYFVAFVVEPDIVVSVVVYDDVLPVDAVYVVVGLLCHPQSHSSLPVVYYTSDKCYLLTSPE